MEPTEFEITAVINAVEAKRAKMDRERDAVPRGRREPYLASYLPRQRREMALAAIQALSQLGWRPTDRGNRDEAPQASSVRK